MKKYIQMGLLSLLIVSVFSACERFSEMNTLSSNSKQITAEENNKEGKEVQVALKKDAQLARTMPLKQFARHMKNRLSYYQKYNASYQDEFVNIEVKKTKMQIETRKGKVKLAL